MSDNEEALEPLAIDHDDADDVAHKGSYVFVPSGAAAPAIDRPPKRRKIRESTNDANNPPSIFPSCLLVEKNQCTSQVRLNTFRDQWRKKEKKIDQIVNHVDYDALAEVIDFVKKAPTGDPNLGIPTGLIVTGPHVGKQARLLELWKADQMSQPSEQVITLHSTDASNLMIILKNIIRYVIIARDGPERYQKFLNDRKKLIPMSYDLELLQEYVKERKIEKVVVSVLDIEAFNVSLLADLMFIFNSWKDRIPFVLLFGIATTVDLFETRLPKSTVRLLEPNVFDLSLSEDRLYDIYLAAQTGSETRLWLGASLINVLLERSKDQDETAEGFGRAIKYIYMSHFFANPLSLLLNDHLPVMQESVTELCEAIRNTESFRKYTKEYLDCGDIEMAKSLVEDDKVLFSEAKQAVENGRRIISQHHSAVSTFMTLLNTLPDGENAAVSVFEVEVQALSGTDFLDSKLYTEALSSLRKLPSTELFHFLEEFIKEAPCSDIPLIDIHTNLSFLHNTTKGKSVHSTYHPSHSTSSTTITKHNTVSLSKHGRKLTEPEKKYATVIDDLHTAFSKYFEEHIINPTSLFLHEAFLYDLKTPLAGAFTPRPRHAIERALGRSGDYLGCVCCDGSGVKTVGARGPATSVLWQLWCEAGGIVNVRDLWDAFSAVIVSAIGEDECDEQEEVHAEVEKESGRIKERMALALFYRGLAELRMMGFAKGTKKKLDCLAKVAWSGF